MMTLGDDEKGRIRAEEIYRQELRRALDAAPLPSRRERIWAVLNSSFALWVLSSIVLTALTASFTAYQSARDDEARQQELQRRLDTEIAGRLSAALFGLRINRERIERGVEFAPDGVYAGVVSYLDNFFITDDANPRDFSVYPEFQRRTLRSLLLELSRVGGTPDLQDLREAAAAYDELSELGNVAQGEPIQAIDHATRVLEQLMIKPRWKPRM